MTNWPQEWVKASLPAPVLARIRAWRHKADVRRFEEKMRVQARTEWRLMLQDWKQQARVMPRIQSSADLRQRSLIFPPDPAAIAGSRGDEAMIAAVLDAVRSASPQAEVDMVCAEAGADIAADMGFRPFVIGADREFATSIAAMLSEGAYDQFFALGADVIDGRYGPRIPALMVITADLAARAGSRATILGCSFGTRPARELKEVFRRLDPRVQLNIRDPLSLERMQAFVPIRPRLVADVAFNLRPGQADPAAAAWIEAQRIAGRRVVGVNVHALLVRNADEAWVEAMASAVTAALSEVAERSNVSWMLLPHDYREGVGDLACLLPIHRLMRERGDVPVHFVKGQHRAADLKALAGRLDGVITGRMHLAIAALGMGVPALGLTYADKFEGLFAHFDLPSSFLMPPSVLQQPAELARRIDTFIKALPALARVIARRQAAVSDLALRNFAKPSRFQS